MRERAEIAPPTGQADEQGLALLLSCGGADFLSNPGMNMLSWPGHRVRAELNGGRKLASTDETIDLRFAQPHQGADIGEAEQSW